MTCRRGHTRCRRKRARNAEAEEGGTRRGLTACDAVGALDGWRRGLLPVALDSNFSHFSLDRVRELTRESFTTGRKNEPCGSQRAQDHRKRLGALESMGLPRSRPQAIPRGRETAAYIVFMEHPQSLTSFSDDELLHRLSDLLSRSRRDEADLVAHIGEVDARRLYAREAQPSMFSYCTEVLHLSEAEASSGSLWPAPRACIPSSCLTWLKGGCTSRRSRRSRRTSPGENCGALLGRAVHRSKRQIEELVAEIAPRPESRRPSGGSRPDGTRRPQPARALAEDQTSREPRATAPDLASVGAIRHELCPEGAATREFETGPDTVAPAATAIELRPEAITATRIELRPDGVANSQTPSIEATTRSGLPRARPEALEPLAPGAIPGPVHRVCRASRQGSSGAEPDRCVGSRRQPGRAHRSRDHREAPEARSSAFRRDGGAKEGLRRRAISHGRVRFRRRSSGPSTSGTEASADTRTSREGGVRLAQGLEFHHRHPFGFGGDHCCQFRWHAPATTGSWLRSTTARK